MPHDHPDHDPPHSPPHAGDARLPAKAAVLARGAGEGKLLFLDAFSGLAGDMLVSALADLGVPTGAIEGALRSLPLAGYEIEWVSRTRHALVGTGFEVTLTEPQPPRAYAAIAELIDRAALPAGAKSLALRAFALLAEAEAAAHRVAVRDVHFHEVGAVDSILDVVGAAVALDYVGAKVLCSPLPMGRGFVRSAHGFLPSPAPATVACLRGVPTYDAGIDAELVTPTGACLVRAAAHGFSRWPSMRPLAVGLGAGSRDLADRPNVLRAVLGEPSGPIDTAHGTHGHLVLELNVDDMTGELAAAALARAQHEGALDVWSTPIGMKKGRPALMLSALVQAGDLDRVARALLSETTSLGVRIREVGRIERPRRMVEVATRYGAIAVKVADGDGLPANVAPEYEACRAAADAHGVPLKTVYAAALAAYHGSGSQ